jgi:hypothetical protein
MIDNHIEAATVMKGKEIGAGGQKGMREGR